MVSVVSVSFVKDGWLAVSLSDGKSGFFDVKPYCASDYFKELLNDDYCAQVKLFFRGVGWPNGQDLSPDTIAAELVPHLEHAA